MSTSLSHFRLSLIAIPAAITLTLSGCGVLNQASDLVQGKSDVFELQVNDCFNDETAETISSVTVIDCADEHDNEIYYEYELASDIFPNGVYNEDAIYEDADATCYSEYEAFTGVTYGDSAIDLSYLFPTSQSWEENDRVIQCLVYLTTGPTSGSLNNKGSDYPLE